MIPSEQIIEYATIVAYLGLMAAMGRVFGRLNRDVSDYFRSGCRATWWLVGCSAFMSMFSAWTFTGAAGAAFQAGWAVLFIYIANALGFFLSFWLFAPWFRQLRAITVPEIVAQRFDRPTALVVAGLTVALGVFGGGLTLYGLSIFCSAFFGFPLVVTICVVGLITLVYSVSGGSWAVMATDFIQTVILMGLTVATAALALASVGGVGAFLEAASSAEMAENFRWVHPPCCPFGERLHTRLGLCHLHPEHSLGQLHAGLAALLRRQGRLGCPEGGAARGRAHAFRRHSLE